MSAWLHIVHVLVRIAHGWHVVEVCSLLLLLHICLLLHVDRLIDRIVLLLVHELLILLYCEPLHLLADEILLDCITAKEQRLLLRHVPREIRLLRGGAKRLEALFNPLHFHAFLRLVVLILLRPAHLEALGLGPLLSSKVVRALRVFRVPRGIVALARLDGPRDFLVRSHLPRRTGFFF